MRSSVPLHYTDVGYGHHPIKQKQHRYMFEWIPYFRAHTMNWDNDDGTRRRRDKDILLENIETGEMARLSGSEWKIGFSVAIPRRSG